MSRSKLLDIIREKSERYCAEILDRNRNEAETLIEESKNAVEKMRNQVFDRIKAESDRLLERKHNTIRFRINARRYGIKSKALQDAWREAGKHIRALEQSDKYRGILEKLFSECIDDVPDDSVVRAAPKDAGIVRACIQRAGRSFIVEEDTHVRGGVEFHWPDGKIVLVNTLSHRLSKLKAEGFAELPSILFAEEKDGKG